MGSIGGATREGIVWSDGLQFKELEFHGERGRKNDRHIRGIGGKAAPLTAANPRSEQGGEGMEQGAHDDGSRWKDMGLGGLGIGCLRAAGSRGGGSLCRLMQDSAARWRWRQTGRCLLG